MRVRTRIKEEARRRGRTAAEVARRLGLYHSNISAMDRGTRTVSLRTLGRIAKFLRCSPGDLLESSPPEAPLFRDQALNRRLKEWELSIPEEAERGWVDTALLAWQRHYRAVR